MARTSYQVVYERDREGFWVAEAADIPQCYAQGRSLASAKRKIREVIAFLQGDAFASRIQLDEVVQVGRELEEKLDRLGRASADLARQAQELEKSRIQLIKALTRQKFSRRDVGELLGISHQRVDQLLSEHR